METTFDERWKRRAVAGDAEAVRLLADQAAGPLWAFCLYRVGRDRGACEEVVQETLVRALGDLRHYDPVRSEGRILGWLTGLARNEIRRAHRESHRALSLDELWERVDAELCEVYAALDTRPLAEDVLEREETRTMVNATMAQLPAHYREALEAKYVAGRSVRDIAGASGQSEKAVESLLVRAREAFRGTFTALARHMVAGPGL